MTWCDAQAAQSRSMVMETSSSNGFKNSKKDSSKNAVAALDIVTPAIAVPIEFAMPRGLTPPPSSDNHLGLPHAPQTNSLHSMLNDACGTQAPATNTSNGGKLQYTCSVCLCARARTRPCLSTCKL